jgi:hypothetical protein
MNRFALEVHHLWDTSYKPQIIDTIQADFLYDVSYFSKPNTEAVLGTVLPENSTSFQFVCKYLKL